MQQDDSTAVVAEQPRKPYETVNHLWPDAIPVCTKIEAERAVRRLWKHLAKRKVTSVRVRRVWVSTHPRGHHRGWGRLIHDTAHRIHRWQNPGKRPHDWRHVWIETEAAKYAISQGWLDGKLKPKKREWAFNTPYTFRLP